MSDNLSPEDRRRTMRAVKGKGTRVERQLFGMLSGMGIRGWRKNPEEIPGKPDVAFPCRRIAIFVDGCFWHRCPLHGTMPRANGAWWLAKLDANVARDRDTDSRLREQGWTAVRIWEHEDAGSAAARVASVVRAARRAGAARAGSQSCTDLARGEK